MFTDRNQLGDLGVEWGSVVTTLFNEGVKYKAASLATKRAEARARVAEANAVTASAPQPVTASGFSMPSNTVMLTAAAGLGALLFFMRRGK